MTFTKTEQALLAEAEASPFKIVSISHGSQGKRGFGRRQQQAAKSLLLKGLLVRVHTDGGTPIYKPKYGINGIIYTGTWKLAAHLTPAEAERILATEGQ